MSGGYDFGYHLRDSFTESPAEQLRNQYRNAIQKVEDLADGLRGSIQDLQNQVATAVQTLEGSACDPSSGQFVTDLNTAIERWKAQVDLLIGPSGSLSLAADQLDDRLQLMRWRLARLQWYCEEEDLHQREFTRDEIHY